MTFLSLSLRLYRHCKTYNDLDIAFDSYDKLSVYLEDLKQVGKLNNKKPVKGSGSTLSVAAGDDDEGGEPGNGELKIDCHGDEKMDEEGEQDKGDVEEGGNANDDDHRVKYRIFIR